MANFWIVDKEEKITGQYELGGGMLDPIPAKTNCAAFVEEAKWDAYDGEDYISLKWKVLAPVEYKNRILFQKLKVSQDDKAKAKKAQQMLLNIDFNAKGKLSTLTEMPTTEDLQKSLCNKPMIINVQVWEIEDKKGNWISSVKPKNGNDPSHVAKKVEPVVEVEVDLDELEF